MNIQIQLPDKRINITYDKALNEVVFRVNDASNLKTLALTPDELLEAVQRRVDDGRYRPISEEDRAREIKERFGPEQPLPVRKRPRR